MWPGSLIAIAGQRPAPVSDYLPQAPALLQQVRGSFGGRLVPSRQSGRDRVAMATAASSTLRVIGPAPDAMARLDADNTRAVWDPDGCCAFRKVEPLRRALAGFDAWISGSKRFQATTRTGLPVFEADGRHIKVNPLAAWTAARRLPRVWTSGGREPVSPNPPTPASTPVKAPETGQAA